MEWSDDLDTNAPDDERAWGPRADMNVTIMESLNPAALAKTMREAGSRRTTRSTLSGI